jgi:hypothetical protein
MVKAILEQTLPNYPRDIAKNGEIWKVQFKGLGNIHEVESIFRVYPEFPTCLTAKITDCFLIYSLQPCML